MSAYVHVCTCSLTNSSFFVCSYLDSDWLDSIGLDNDECDACVSLEAGEANTARAHVVLRHDAARAHYEQVRGGACQFLLV